MQKNLFGLLSLCLLVLLCGCGTDDFQAGNRLILLSLTDQGGSSSPILFANEETDDSGVDGDPTTSDDVGFGDGFPDEGENPITPISSDIGVIELANEARPGVDEGVELQIYLIDVTYFDANGNTPAFAPRYRQNVAASVDTGSTISLEFTLVPLEMKIVEGGLRDIFLFGSAAAVSSVSRMTAVVDVYARDVLNNDTVLTQAAVTVQFVNPMVSKPIE